MTISKVFFYFCVSFVLGIFLNSFIFVNQILFFLFLGLFFIFWKNKKIRIFGFCILFFVFGIWKHQTARAQLERPGIEKFYEQKVLFTGKVIEEPDIRIDKIKLKTEIEDSKTYVLITTKLFPQINYGDKLKIQGILKEPQEFEGFNYKDYLKNQKIYFLMYYPEIEILERGKGNQIKTFLISLKQKLKQSLQNIIPFSQVGFFEALIFGDENNISDAWKEKLNITGVRHIAAVSGMNVTIISVILLNFVLALGFWRQQSLWISIVLISFYILMIGAPSCAVRAGIMAGLLLISQNFGRLVIQERILVFTLALMLFFNPLLLKNNIGFQLSFLAIAGLVYLQPLFLKLFEKLPDFLELRTNLSSTLAAQIFVLPILLYNFGQFSLVSPLTNILILPFIPFLTIFGFLFSFSGIFWKSLAQIISFPAQILLTIIMKIIDFSSQILFASKQIYISGIFVFISYLLLAIIILYSKRTQKPDFLDY